MCIRDSGILIAASSGSDIIKVGHAVESKLEELKAGRLPAGVECHKIFYQPERVGSSLGTFVINLIESVIIVVLILTVSYTHLDVYKRQPTNISKTSKKLICNL